MRDASLSAQKFQDFPEERAAPPKRRADNAAAPPRAPKKKRSALARFFGMHRAGVMTLAGIGGLALVGVPLNALFFQDGRHPAPLFSTHVLTPETPEPAAKPTPPARSARTESGRLGAEAARSEAAPRAAPKAARAVTSRKADPLAEIIKSEPTPSQKGDKKREVASRDPISNLIGGSGTTATKTAPPADKNVLSAQRALLRLGYVVKPDGIMTPGLRKTIEKFERDNGLPVTGELGPKVAKRLAARLAASQ